MPSEARRGLVRMAANYGRLFASVCLGLILVRVVIRGAGNDAWALISLLGATIGIAAMLQDVVRSSMVRELGEAHHGGDPDRFLSMYNSALVVTAVIGAIALVALGVVLLILPVLRIPPDLLTAARWLVAAKGLETFVLIVLGAPMNMYVATERMVPYNAWLVCFRACPLAAATWVFIVKGVEDPSRGLILYAVISSSLFIAMQLLAATTMIVMDRRLVPRPRRIRRESVRELVRIGGWNASALVSLSSHVQVDNILMNLFFGLFGNFIFGLTTQLTSYVRMLTMGVTFGLDAVSARLSTSSGPDSLRRLCHHATRMHGIVALPAAVGLVVLAEPILLTWLGDRIEDPANSVPATVLLMRVMAIGMVCRAVSDGWLKILYGAGHVARYAPLIVTAAVANPIISIALLFAMRDLPAPTRYAGAAIAYSTVFVIVNLGLVPRLAGRLIGMRTTEVVAPLLRPLIVTAVSAPVLIVAARRVPVEDWTLLTLFAAAAVFGVVYGGLTVLFVFERREQQRFAGIVRKLLRV